MQIDRRITNGLAWAGVVLVVGVPVADLLSAQLTGETATPSVAVIGELDDTPEVAAAPVAPVPAPASDRPDEAEAVVEVAAVEPAAPVAPVTQVSRPAAVQTGDVVGDFVNSGRPMPSYITGGEAAQTQVAATPQVGRTPIATDPVEVAAIPAKVAPVPMPLTMRPRPIITTTPAPVAAAAETPLIIPDAVVPAPTLTPAYPVNPSPVPPVNVAPAYPTSITAADLDDWESGPLSEFLAQRQGQTSNAQVTYERNDGFWLDQSPVQPQGDILIGPAQDQYFFPFSP
jgi:hypothetical protein